MEDDEEIRIKLKTFWINTIINRFVEADYPNQHNRDPEIARMIGKPREFLVEDDFLIWINQAETVDGEIVYLIHRDNGPAVVTEDHKKQWWWKNHQLNFEEWLDFLPDKTAMAMKLKYMGNEE